MDRYEIMLEEDLGGQGSSSIARASGRNRPEQGGIRSDCRYLGDHAEDPGSGLIKPELRRRGPGPNRGSLEKNISKVTLLLSVPSGRPRRKWEDLSWRRAPAYCTPTENAVLLQTRPMYPPASSAAFPPVTLQQGVNEDPEQGQQRGVRRPCG